MLLGNMYFYCNEKREFENCVEIYGITIIFAM